MKRKISALCILLAVLMTFPVLGVEVLSSDNWTGTSGITPEVLQLEELRGVWIASVYNNDFPSKPGLTADQQKKELDEILNNAEYMGLNAIFFQVRPTGDALYKSSIFPTSSYLTGQQGKANDKDFDPLSYIITEGHKKGIQIHAWINPLRLTMGSTQSPTKDISKLSDKHPVKKMSYAAVSAPNGQMYLDPGYPEVIKLVTDGVAEIVKNYDIDGIHFDDYFYPQKTGSKDFDDNASYSKYKGSFNDKGEWRRNNINNLIKGTYDTVKSIKPQVQFGVSPFGLWASKYVNSDGSDTARGNLSSYYDQYADSRKWVKEGYLDYIAPQIYWNIGNDIADYQKVLQWWTDVCKGTNVKLYTGQAAYKINDSSPTDWLDPLQIPKQIALNRTTNAVSGNIYYGYGQLKKDALGIKEKLRGIYVVGNSPDSTVPEDRKLIINSPSSGYKTSSSNVSILGSCDPKKPLFMNGKQLEVTTDGYFTTYASLSTGENTFTFEHKGEKKILKITKTASSSNSSYDMKTPQFKSGSFSPTQSMTMKTGQKIDFSCIAPDGAKVWVEIGGYKVNLSATNAVKAGTIPTNTYKGTFTFPTVTTTAKTLSLGKPVFVMEYKGKKITSKQSNTLTVQSAKYNKYAVVNTSAMEVATRSGPSSNHSRLTPLINGASDNIVGLQNNYYLLSSGVWISSNDVKVVNDKPLGVNKVSSVSVSAGNSYTAVDFKMPINTVYDVTQKDDILKLTLYNTIGSSINKTAPTSSPFTKITASASGANMVYTFKLKSSSTFYGYYAQYKNGTFTFYLKNAPKIQKTGSKPLTGLTVLLDAGHGGTESGAYGPLGTAGLVEKQINLSMTLHAKAYLEKLGASVIMTRTTDKTVSLNDRANMIRKEKPDISVSIHNNAMDNVSDFSKSYGLMVLYSQDNSKPTSDYIKDYLVNNLNRNDKGSRWQSLSLCIPTQNPAVLVEGGFMSNPEEYQWLSLYENQVTVGQQIGKAIEKWAYANAR